MKNREEHPAFAEAIQEARQHKREVTALMKASRAVLTSENFQEAARHIFGYCRELIGATSGYVALLNEAGDENEVLFLESGGLPCTVDPALPMPIRGLRAETYRTGYSAYHNDFMNSRWIKFMPKGHVVLKNVLFAPLLLEGRTIGLLGIANKPGGFDDRDAQMAAAFGELAAIALRNSRHLENRRQAEKQKEKLIEELKTSLAQIKTLHGLLPICSWCKKIRDDQGYWKQIEAYLAEHSQAEFSHSVCPECRKKYDEERRG